MQNFSDELAMKGKFVELWKSVLDGGGTLKVVGKEIEMRLIDKDEKIKRYSNHIANSVWG